MTRRAPVLAVVSLLVVPLVARAQEGARVIRVDGAAERESAATPLEGKTVDDLQRWPELRFAPDAADRPREGEDDGAVIPEDVDRVLPETLDYWEHRQHLADARIVPGQPVGGTALVGVRLAPQRAAGRVTAIEGDPVTTGLAAWDGFGAFVLDVVRGSPADDAGLQVGDVVVQYGGTWIDTQELLVQLASRSIVGREREVWLLRGDIVLKTWLVPAER